MWKATVEMNETYELTIPQNKAPYTECGDYIIDIIDRGDLPAS